jgi:hypothetical protein
MMTKGSLVGDPNDKKQIKKNREAEKISDKIKK